MSKIVLTNEPGVPPTPAATTVTLFAQGNSLFSLDSFGVVTLLGGGGGGVLVDAPLVGDGSGGNHLRLAPVGQANGDLLARTAGAWARLAVGTAAQVLTVVGGAPAWATPSFVPVARTLTGSSPIIFGGDNLPHDLSVDRTIGFALTGETNGDLFVRLGGAWSRLPIGTMAQVLTVAGAVPVWVTPAVPLTYLPLCYAKYVTDVSLPAATSEIPGGNTWYASEHNVTGARTVRLRVVLGNEDGNVLHPVQVALFSIANMAYVLNLDGVNPYLETTLQSGTVGGSVPLVSQDLRAGHANFTVGANGDLYEVHVRSMFSGKTAILHKAELVIGLP